MTCEYTEGFLCEDCQEFRREREKNALYECSCGAIWNRENEGTHRCPECGKFGKKISDYACPICGDCDFAPKNLWFCSECDDSFETQEEADEHDEGEHPEVVREFEIYVSAKFAEEHSARTKLETV